MTPIGEDPETGGCLRVAVVQVPNCVGDLEGNAERIAAAMDWAQDEAEADVLVLPELALTGYGLRDVVLHQEFVEEAGEKLAALARRSGTTTTILSTIDRVPPRRTWDTREREVAIGAALLCGGELRGMYHKVMLPLYELFEEARNFAAGRQPDLVWRIGDVVAGVCICEDLWSDDGPPEAQAAAGAQILFAPNASPYHRGKAAGRLANTRAVAQRNGVPVVYVNLCGAQDKLIFDGGSIVVGGDGELIARGAEFDEDRFCVDVPVAPARSLSRSPANVHTRPVLRAHGRPYGPPRPPMSDTDAVWSALMQSVRHWVELVGMEGAALGLSGGIDSAVTAVLAVDALGPENVLALFLPSPETPDDEADDARALAATLGIEFDERELETLPADAPAPDEPLDRERRYAQLRGAVLLTVSQERSRLLLATGNKTEVSLGEPALFGDLIGQFAPLRDCSKTLVFELAHARQRANPVLPEGILHRPRTSQRLPPAGSFSYARLDDLVEGYVERGEGLADLVAAGHDPEAAEDVLQRIDSAELIRRFAPPGPKVSARAFDQDRHMPLANAWRPHLR